MSKYRGISDEALDLSDLHCSIPMKGMVDSFNVSVAAGILMHHAVCDRTSRLVMILHLYIIFYIKNTGNFLFSFALFRFCLKIIWGCVYSDLYFLILLKHMLSNNILWVLNTRQSKIIYSMLAIDVVLEILYWNFYLCNWTCFKGLSKFSHCICKAKFSFNLFMLLEYSPMGQGLFICFSTDSLFL